MRRSFDPQRVASHGLRTTALKCNLKSNVYVLDLDSRFKKKKPSGIVLCSGLLCSFALFCDFCVNFGFVYPVSVKNAIGILLAVVWNLCITFGKKTNATILILLTLSMAGFPVCTDLDIFFIV